ncbi:AraC family transcriptional regulator [Sinobacterium caligoides]|uniref:AraC family transcriptional regulator n=1 Tax=Sinobacterium caligoides TaxID=933926 RepID=A0A3N2DKC7_9GAMM|nr:helix-turn-helix transcriptional regulator [Sinobacterium caligoides]ROS00261.1 AraC family transcriptional regulator [Sinobacterium caligoides]
MAVIQSDCGFDSNQYEIPVVGIAVKTAKHDSGVHSHIKDQLALSVKGCTTITIDGQKCVLPPMRAAWIPGGVDHRAQMSNVTDYRSLYFDRSLQSRLPRELMIVDVNPLLRELIERMAFWPFDMTAEQQMNALNLFIEEFASAKDSHLNLPLPHDYRLQSWLETINAPDFMAPTLNDLSERVGASAKTITRIFNKETGMSYQSWRQQWRLLGAIELLSNEVRVNEVADRLGFSSDSAFISFFRQQTGCTPLAYFSR